MNGIWSVSTAYGLLGWLVSASVASASLCDDAARHAANEIGVPVEVMQTITRLETGRGTSGDPWPWAVNHAGNGSWFPTEDAARSFVFSKIKQGARNIDIGCFQINYRWHGERFRSLDEMFDPWQNALYAARFLKNLHAEFGTWVEAAGAYHSRTPVYAERYKAKFMKLHRAVKDSAPADDTDPPAERLAHWGQSGTAQRGSLFLSDASGAKPFITLRQAN